MTANTKKILQKAAITASAFLFGLCLTTTNIALENEDTVTSALGQSNYEVVEHESEDGEVVNTEYFETEFDNIRELVYNGFLVQEQEQAEGTVLLKNDNNALPLAKGSKVSLFGNACASPFYGASGSGGINTTDAISWFEAFGGIYHGAEDPMADLQGEAYFQVNEKLKDNYTEWMKNKDYAPSSSTTSVKIGDVPWDVIAASEGGADIANYGDAAIMIIKRTGGEGYDLPATSSDKAGEYSHDKTSASSNDGTDGDYLQLNANEKSILEGLKQLKAEGKVKKIILILNMASTIQLDFLADDTYDIDACVWAGAVGEVGTVAVAKLLTGEYNFSGGLSTTLWADHLANPVNSNFMDQNYYFTYENYADYGFAEMTSSYQSTFTTYVVYQEGMYLGYKYTETRYEDYVMGTANTGDYDYDSVVAYPFGYGMSYTEFSFSDLNISKGDGVYKVQVTVKNDGNVAGKTPVQVYISKPYGSYEKENDIQVPSVQLIDFGKTGTIEPGKTETVTIEVDEKYFATYDTFGAGTYVLTPGDYRLTVAANAHDAVNNVLASKGYTPDNTDGRMDAEGDKGMVRTFNYSLNTNSDYSYAEATGNKISNNFEFADINTYEGKGSNSVEYYDRSDWEGTVKLSYRDASGKLVKPYAKLTMTQQMADEMRDQMDADVVIEKGGEYPTYGADNGRKLIEYMNVPYDDQLWDELLDQLTWDETVDLLSNGRHKTQAIQSVSKPATGDENGPNGYNTRYSEASGGSKYSGPTNPYADRIDDPDLGAGYSTTGFSSNGILAATFNKELSYDIGKQIGEEGFWAGMAGWLGTGLNIQRSPYAGRTSEYYSEDAMLSGLIAAPEVEAMQSMGMNCFIKHCALNESETARHGACEWISEQALRENYLRAFEIAIVDGGSYSVMTAFNRMGVIAVANCVEFSQGWLRQEVGLPGIIETDCAGDMTDGAHGEAYVSRICNVYTGATDLNEYNYATDAPDYTGGTHTYADFAPDENGEGDYGNLAQAMREAAHRILWTTVHTAAMSGMSSNTDIVRITPPWKIGIIAADIALGVLLAGSVAWMAVDQAIAFKKKQSV